MAISFNRESVWNLTPIDPASVRAEVNGLLIQGEEVAAAFKTVRDQLIFTNKRIISVDVQGLTGRKKSFTSLPYAKIQFFSVRTPGFLEIFPDSELFVMYSNGYTARFEFRGNVDIGAIGRLISRYVLEE